jgi:hypothetical protein
VRFYIREYNTAAGTFDLPWSLLGVADGFSGLLTFDVKSVISEWSSIDVGAIDTTSWQLYSMYVIGEGRC